MIRVALDLENSEDLQRAKAQWKFAPGLVPGEPNEGLTARLSGSPARLADYDDSTWELNMHKPDLLISFQKTIGQ